MIGIMNSKQRAKNIWPVLAFLLAGFLLIVPMSAAQAQAGDGCAVMSPTHVLTLAQITALANTPGLVDVDMSCRNLTADVSPDARLQYCISGACSGGTDVMCCMPGIGADRGLTPIAPGAPAGGGGGLRLVLPACTANGDCGLNDIVQMGVNFANFLFGISGAIFLAIFVYAGFKYIFFASNSSEINSSKGMLVNATIGIILMFGASALVTTVYNSFRAGSSGSDAQCTASYPANTCQQLNADYGNVTARDAEIRERSCRPGLCGADNQLVCCPTR